MPSVLEISKYLNKYAVLKKDRTIYEEEINEDIEYDLEVISRAENERVISDIATSLSLIRVYYSKLYITSTKDTINEDYFNTYYLSSLLLLACNHFNENSLNDFFNESLANQGEILLTSFACQDFSVIETFYPKIIESIKNGKMSRSLSWKHDEKGNTRPPEPQRLGVLAVEMMASEHKQTVDWASANIPADPFYSRFCKEALYSEDKETLVYWLTKLCDNHLQWTSLFMDNAERSSPTGYEIEQDMLLLWPFEYQAVKNFRTRHGLSTPEIKHPLLETSMSIEHRPNFREWNKPEWVEPLIDRLVEVNPELNFVHQWIKG